VLLGWMVAEKVWRETKSLVLFALPTKDASSQSEQANGKRGAALETVNGCVRGRRL